jgi:hypothetical protein
MEEQSERFAVFSRRGASEKTKVATATPVSLLFLFPDRGA